MDSLIIFGAKYLFILVVLFYGLAIYQASSKHKKALLVSFIIAGVIAVVLDKIGGKLYYDPRPFTHGLKPLISHSADNGFPSEHTVLAITISSALVYYRRRLGFAALAIALIVGICRVAAHVHSPIDIIGGIAIGIVAGTLAYWLTGKLLKDKKSKKS